MTEQFPRGVEVTCAVIIRNKEGKILLVLSPKFKGKYALPGGHVEPGEKIMDAAIRETKEETGLDAKPVGVVRFGELISSTDFHRPIHAVYFDCLVEVEETKVILDFTEGTDFAWVTPEEALKMDIAKGYENDLNGYIEYLKKNI